MYKLISLFVLSLFTGSLSAKFNDRIYQGINPDWIKSENVQDRLEIIRQFLPKNPTVFEVGAKDGDDTVKLANTWPEGRIISFEANPNQFKKYQEKALKYPNMQGHNLAVHTYNGFTKFFLCWGTGGKDPVFEGASSLLEPSEDMKVHYMGPEIVVPCVIFDDWCKQNKISNVDFMWLDLEGFEKQFIQSSPQILKTVKVIYTETNFYKFRKGTTPFDDLKQILEKEGFRLIAHWYNEGLQGDAIFIRN